MKVNRKYLKESLKEGMSRLEIMKYNKALYSRLEKSLNNLPNGLKKYVIKYYGLPWCKNNNWLGGMSDSASNKAIYKILSLGDYTEDEIMDEMDNFISCFEPDTNKSEDEKLKLYLNESLNEDLFDVPRDLADSICKYLDSKNFYNYELVDYDSYPMDTSKITFEVDGDWKHDHLRFKDLVYDWSFENNKNIFKIDSELVRDDGSDSYASNYFVYVTKDEDALNSLKSMSGLFSESVVYPNGMPASDIDIHDALNFNFGLDRDMNDDSYTDEEKQRSLNYWINKMDEIDESLNEASYGGAYDIEDDMFFTKEELVEFAGDIVDQFSAWSNHSCDIENVYMDGPTTFYIGIYDYDDDVSHSAETRIDMRKIKNPKDIYKYEDKLLKLLKDSYLEYHDNDDEEVL